MKETKKTRISDLIALCYMIDSFERFNKNMYDLIKEQNNRESIYQLLKLSKGKPTFTSRKIKKFYEENKQIIDTINKYSNLNTFICENYDYKENMKNENNTISFYNYLKTNRKNINQIIELLEKMKQLEIEYIEFEKKEYKMYKEQKENIDFYYLENMEAIPNYQEETIKYKTNKSNYMIIIGITNYKKIIVNNLLFNTNSLPSEISKTIIYDTITKLKQEKIEDYKKIKTSIDLNLSIENLYTQYENAIRVIETLDFNKKQETIETLKIIRQQLNKLQILSENYDEEIINNQITKELLKQEKKHYIQKKSK